jgi:hypothetical protein
MQCEGPFTPLVMGMYCGDGEHLSSKAFAGACLIPSSFQSVGYLHLVDLVTVVCYLPCQVWIPLLDPSISWQLWQSSRHTICVNQH